MTVPGAGRFNIVLSLGAACCCIAATIVLLLLADRGFDITDEGYYLLSSQRPSDVLAPANGFFYLPSSFMLDSVGGDLAAFRRLGLLLLIASSLFMALGLRRIGGNDGDRGSTIGWCAAIATGGLAYYGIGILTPSYNILALIGITCAYGCTLRSLVEHGRGATAWAVGAGACVTFTLVAKWPSGVLLVAALTAWMLLSPGKRVARTAALWIGAGILLLLIVLLHSPGIMFERFGNGLQFLDRLGSPHADGIFIRYIGQLSEFSLNTIVLAVLPAIIVAVLARTRGFGSGWWSAIAALWYGWWLLLDTGKLDGGTPDRERLAIALAGWLLVMCIGWISLPPDRRHDEARGGSIVLPILAMLALPLIFAFGTGTSLPRTAGSACIGLVATILMVAALAPGRPRVGMALTAMVLAAVVGASIVSMNEQPYRQNLTYGNHVVDTELAGGTIRLDPHSAEFFTRLRTIAEEHGFTPGTDLIGITNLPGVVAALGGRAPGVPWLHGRYPGTVDAANFGLDLGGRQRLRDAWLLNADRGGIDPNLLTSRFGRHFPDDYTYCGQAWWPNDVQRGFIQLWKPADARVNRMPVTEMITIDEPVEITERGQVAGPFIVDGLHGRFRLDAKAGHIVITAIEPATDGRFALQIRLGEHAHPWIARRDRPMLVKWSRDTGPGMFIQQDTPGGLDHLPGTNFRVYPNDDSTVMRTLDAGESPARIGLNWNPPNPGDSIAIEGLQIQWLPLH
jgi:hypothetical protein